MKTTKKIFLDKEEGKTKEAKNNFSEEGRR